MIILDEPISPGTPSEFVAAAVVLELSSTFEEQIHGWKRVSLLGVVRKELQKMSNGLKIVEFAAQVTGTNISS